MPSPSPTDSDNTTMSSLASNTHSPIDRTPRRHKKMRLTRNEKPCANCTSSHEKCDIEAPYSSALCRKCKKQGRTKCPAYMSRADAYLWKEEDSKSTKSRAGGTRRGRPPTLKAQKNSIAEPPDAQITPGISAGVSMQWNTPALDVVPNGPSRITAFDEIHGCTDAPVSTPSFTAYPAPPQHLGSDSYSSSSQIPQAGIGDPNFNQQLMNHDMLNAGLHPWFSLNVLPEVWYRSNRPSSDSPLSINRNYVNR